MAIYKNLIDKKRIKCDKVFFIVKIERKKLHYVRGG